MSILDSLLVGKYNAEYYDLIKRYKDLKRTSIFCRYYNINENASSNEQTVTYNKFSKFDIYDYTPIFRIDSILDSSQESNEKNGLKFDAEFSLNVYTIVTPRINDLITFPYEANNKNIIYRVKALSTPINSLLHEIKYFQLSLEYASIKDIDVIKLNNHYVYLISEGRNITKNSYIEFINTIELIKPLFTNFDEDLELYSDFSLYHNKIILEFLNKFDIYFFNVKKPFYVLTKEPAADSRDGGLLIKYINTINANIQNAKI